MEAGNVIKYLNEWLENEVIKRHTEIEIKRGGIPFNITRLVKEMIDNPAIFFNSIIRKKHANISTIANETSG